MQEKTGLDEAVITGTGKINRRDVVINVCDTSFLMGSMGYVVGEKITRAMERATKVLLVLFLVFHALLLFFPALRKYRLFF